MRQNLLYPFWVWLVSSLFISLACACWPIIRHYPIDGYDMTFFYRVGFFCGVFAFLFENSVHLFFFLALLYYIFTARFYLSGLLIKSALIFFFLIGVFILNRINYPGTWLHPFFMVYSGLAIISFFLIDIYRNGAYSGE